VHCLLPWHGTFLRSWLVKLHRIAHPHGLPRAFFALTTAWHVRVLGIIANARGIAPCASTHQPVPSRGPRPERHACGLSQPRPAGRRRSPGSPRPQGTARCISNGGAARYRAAPPPTLRATTEYQLAAGPAARARHMRTVFRTLRPFCEDFGADVRHCFGRRCVELVLLAAGHQNAQLHPPIAFC
jgi:hypothetical protein